MAKPDDEDGFAGEVTAIGDVIDSLAALSGPARERVIEYVMKALSIRIDRSVQASAPAGASSALRETTEATPPVTPTAVNDIRSLRESKQPNSANQMTAVAAYYLSELAPESERSNVIDATQLDRLFRQAGFPLPQRINQTLVNAAQAGYLDGAGEPGKYRLNPVGYNLVVHSLPSGGERTAPRRPAKKASARKAPAKKASAKKAPAKKASPKKAPAKKV